MFFSIFNYTKLFCWGIILFLNYKWTDKCNLDLLNILLYNIQNTNVLAVKCIQKIVPYLKMSDCDEKIINLLNQTYEDNIYHSDEHTLKLYKSDFNKDFSYDYKIINNLSSGSIGQVYKIQSIKDDTFYAMKVIHPNIKYHLSFINNIIYIFNLNKHTIFELDVFIRNFTDETDFLKESEHMKFFYENYKNNERILIPKLFKSSKNIIIMEYIHGEQIRDLSSYESGKYINFALLFNNNNKYLLNYNHGDMHLGNFKKHEHNKLVIYDFGACFSIKDKELVDILDTFYYHLYNKPNLKYTYIECIEYLVKFNIDGGDIEKYRHDINHFFINEKIKDLSDLTRKSYLFFKKNNIKSKMDYLNLIINFYYSANLNDSYNIDLLSICQTYDIFKEYQKHLKKYIFYVKETSIEKDKVLYDEFKKLL